MAGEVSAKRMKFLLDSNMLIALGLASNEAVRKRAAECDQGDLVTSAVVFSEVLHGSVRGKPPVVAHLQALLEEIPVLPFDEQAARAYATLPFKRASYDRLIAAHALAMNLTVVTGNLGDFADIPGLMVEDWTV